MKWLLVIVLLCGCGICKERKEKPEYVGTFVSMTFSGSSFLDPTNVSVKTDKGTIVVQQGCQPEFIAVGDSLFLYKNRLHPKLVKRRTK